MGSTKNIYSSVSGGREVERMVTQVVLAAVVEEAPHGLINDSTVPQTIYGAHIFTTRHWNRTC